MVCSEIPLYGKRGWRTAVIFNTNMRAAHMAGKWQQLWAGRKRYPYLQYRTAGDSRVRPLHRQWNGQIYRIDDLFWQTHYPPNDYGCRCTVRALSQADMDEDNLQVSSPYDIKYRSVTTSDGEVIDQVPVGIGPGWDHNVGQSWIAPELALGQKIAALPKELRGALADKAISPAFQKVLNADFKAFQTAIKEPVGAAKIVGFMDSGMLNAISEKLPDIQLNTTAVTVLDRKIDHLSGAHKASNKQAWPEDWFNNLPEHFSNYRAVLWDKIHESLVVIPLGNFNGTIPKIAIRLNQKTKYGKAASVVSLGSSDAHSLKDSAKFELLLGTL